MTKLITGVGYLIFDIKFYEYLVTVATMGHLLVIMENHGNSALEALNNSPMMLNVATKLIKRSILVNICKISTPKL